MKILVPVNDPSAIIQMAQNSEATEFYAGFEDSEWEKQFGAYEDLNRMSSFRRDANMSTTMMTEIMNAAIYTQRDIYVTLNAGIYSIAQQTWLMGLIERIKDSKATGVILGDPFLVEEVRKAGLKCVASTMVGVYNKDIAKMCAKIGFERVILPRDVTLNEIEEIVTAVPELEYECFLMRNGCRYSDSFCLCKHSDHYGALCTYLDRAMSTIRYPSEDFSKREEAVFNHALYKNGFHKDACGICAIWRLEKIGIAAGKVVGRADRFNSVCQDVQVIEKNLNIAKLCSSEREYLEKMIYPERCDMICMKGLCCYYPEVRFGEKIYEKD